MTAVDTTALAAWYAPRRAAYPWRRPDPDPYHVLVSEVMLQQTQASRVVPAFAEFLRRFPTVRALAAAPRAEVIRAWDGLGYDRRAVSLSEAARIVVRHHGGRVPSAIEALRSLPGVGPYTAAAIAALAFGAAEPAVDVNVRRVVARFALGMDAHEVPPAGVEAAARTMLDPRDPGTWNQAVMDLGREVCRPLPRCEACPLAHGCRFRAGGRVPGRAPRRQSRFEGSFRQTRGRVVRTLRRRETATLSALVRETGEPLERVARAVAALAGDGVLEAGPAAIAGNPRGRVRLAR